MEARPLFFCPKRGIESSDGRLCQAASARTVARHRRSRIWIDNGMAEKEHRGFLGQHSLPGGGVDRLAETLVDRSFQYTSGSHHVNEQVMLTLPRLPDHSVGLEPVTGL